MYGLGLYMRKPQVAPFGSIWSSRGLVCYDNLSITQLANICNYFLHQRAGPFGPAGVDSILLYTNHARIARVLCYNIFNGGALESKWITRSKIL
jgi:hypothetical protein